MKIRGATLADIPKLVEYGEKFYQQTRHIEEGIPYNPDEVAILCEWLINVKQGFILVLDDDGVVGFVLVVEAPFPFSPDIRTAQELAYYVDEDYRKTGLGVKLLEHTEKVCKDRGVRYLTMISMESCIPRQAEALYEKLGYSRTETSYTKELM